VNQLVTEASAMFLLEVDVSLCFVPPMDEHRPGIMVTRTLELPFPPASGLFITGIAMNGQPLAQGFKLEDVTWDLDRHRFLAATSLTSEDFPIAEIPWLIRDWIERGWRLGSYEDAYEGEVEYQHDPLLIEPIVDIDVEDEEGAKRWPMMGPRSRPPAFNKFLRALAREMAGLYNNWSIAYAMLRTNTLFTEEQLKHNKSRAAAKFNNARSEFDRMTFDQQYDWRQKVLRRPARRRRNTAKNQ
jgi:hypothetical protein